MENWKTHRIEDLTEEKILIIGDGYRAKNSELSNNGLPFARGANINQGFLFDEAECLDISNLQKAGDKISRIGDVVFTSKGTVGRFAFVRENTKKFVYSPQLCYWRILNSEFIYPRYLYFWVHSKEFFEQYNGVKNQTDMADYVSLNNQRRFHITLPPIEEQRRIAEILSSLDDKIELNRRMNATLEAMAKTLFKAWFIDFEPVRANLENRPSESASPEIAKLFPNEFDGDLPKGWEEKELKDIFEINPFRKVIKGKKTKFLDMANVPTSGHSISNLAERQFSSGMKFTNGDTLLARITPCLENGKTAFVDFLKKGEVGFGSTEFIVLRPKQLPDYFAYLLCRFDDFRAFAIQSMTGTSGRQRVQTDRLATYKVAVPTEVSSISAKLDEILTPIVNRISQNSFQTKVLEQLRDSLLPRLISGKIKVGEAEN